MSSDELELVFKNMPHVNAQNGLNIVDFLVNTGICSSKREAREFVVSSSITINDRKYTSFNILEKDTLNLFTIISSGEYLINGFSNKLIREKYLKKEITKKDINKLTRLLSKLKAHGIIKKVARKNKYYLTTNGRKIINSILIYTRKTLLT